MDSTTVKRGADGRVERVSITPKAAELLGALKDIHGPLMFHQSGGCCDGSSPMCYPRGDFLGSVADTPFYMSNSQYDYWKHTHLTVDVVKGRGSGFSVEAPEGVRFLIRSGIFSDDEYAHLLAEGDPPRGEHTG